MIILKEQTEMTGTYNFRC